MQNYNFGSSSLNGTAQQVQTAKLVANAGLAEVARIDASKMNTCTVTFAVTVAALTGVTVLGRGDKNAAFIPIPITELIGYGRSDSSSDYTTTPAGASGVVSINASMWSEISIQATSAGVAVLLITAGWQ